MTHFEIISYGKLHDDDPEAHVHVDLRTLLRDPHLDPALRELTGINEAVRQNVLRQPGAVALVGSITTLAEAVCLASAPGEAVRVGIACAGGRHRSVVIAEAVATVLIQRTTWDVRLIHRHVRRPVVTR